MNEENQLQTIEELKTKLAATELRLEKVFKEQQESGKMLIRRDLALSRVNDKLRDLDIAKSDFISVAAHQLRTPLSAMKWILSMLVNKEFTTELETEDFTKKAYESCERMIALVNDLLEADHVQSGKDQFTFEPVDIEPLIQNVLNDLTSTIATKKLSVQSVVPQGSIVEGDREKLHAVLQNLIENAIKYTPEGKKVLISFKINGKVAEISIKDEGIGIPPESQKLIFSKFFRAPNAMKVDTVGSGLGLFIVKQIIERHGGTIRFESDTSGSTFNFSIPVPMSVVIN